MEGDSEYESEGADEEEEEEVPAVSHLSLSQKLSEGFIPNAQFIHAARKQREEKRQMGSTNTAGFIPLTKKKVPTAKGKSRLVREDDNDQSDSGGEDGGRRRMDVGGRDDVAAKQFRVLQGLEERGSDSDEETKRWEEEQIEKGVKASAPDLPPPLPPSHLSTLDQTFMVGVGVVGEGCVANLPPLASNAPQGFGIHKEHGENRQNWFQTPVNLVPISVESLKSRLSAQLRDLREAHSDHRERLEHIRSLLSSSREEVEEAGGRRGELGGRYQFFQEMRGYLRDLLSCLKEKVK